MIFFPPKNILLTLGLIFIAYATGYGEAKTDPAAEVEVQRLTLDIPSLYLINGISLSADQNKQLLDFLKKRANAHKQKQQAIQEFIANNLNKKKTDFMLDLLLGDKKALQAVQRKVRPNVSLQNVYQSWRSLNEWGKENTAQNAELEEMAQKTLVMLTSDQRDILDRFTPCFIPPDDFLSPKKSGQDDADTSSGETMAVEFKKQDKSIELEKLNIRMLNTGKLEIIKLYMLNPGIISTISRRAGDLTSDSRTPATPAASREEIKKKYEMFDAAVLFTTLQLTAGQAQQLLPCAHKAGDARKENEQEADAIYPKALQAYQTLKKDIENQQVSPQTEQEAAKYHQELKALEKDKTMEATLLQCEAEMDKVLSADQTAFLIGHKTYNIAGIRGLANELFDALDGIKDKNIDAHANALSATFFNNCLRGNVYDPTVTFDRDSEIIRIQQTILRAKRMSKSEYQKCRKDLIAEICPRRSTPRPAAQEYRQVDGKWLHVDVPYSTTRLLLSPTGLTLLEKKIQIGN